MALVAARSEYDARFRAAVETMIDCLGIYRALRDDDGQIVDFIVEYVNEAACRNNQLTRDEQIGRRLCEILPGHRDSGLFAEYCRVCETQVPLVKEMLVYTDSYGGQVLQRAFDIRVTPLDDGFVAAWRDVTERKQAEERLRFLADIGTALAASLDIEETLQTATRLAIPLVADACTIHRFEPDGTLRLLATAAHDPHVEAVTSDLLALLTPADQTMAPIRAIRETRRPYLMTEVPDAAVDGATPAIVHQLGIHSAIVVPLMVQQQLLGLLSFGFTVAGRRYSADDLPFAEEIARRVGLALENAWLYHERQRAEVRTQLLDAASRTLSASLDYTLTLQKVAGFAVPALADLCLVHLADEHGALSDVAVACADPTREALVREMLDRYPPHPAVSPGLGEVLQSGKTVHRAQVPPDFAERVAHDAAHADLIRRIGPRAFLTTPLAVDGQTLGVLQLVLTEPGRAYDAADVHVVEELARRCAQAIERARLYSGAQAARALAEQAAARSQHLLAVAEILAQPLTAQQAAEAALAESVAALQATAGQLFLLSDDQQSFELVATSGYTPALATQWQRFPVTAPLPIGDAFRTREPVWIESLAAVRERYPAFVAAAHEFTGAVAVLPLIATGQVLGGLRLSFAQPRRFTRDDRTFARSLAQQCAQVLSRTRLDAALRMSEARYRSLVRHFPNGTVYVFDRDLRYLIAGGDALAVFGLTPEQLEGHTIWECLPPDLIAVAEPLYRATLDGTAAIEHEQHYHGHIFRRIPVPLRDAQGEIVAGMVISQEITAMKQAEALLRELNATLEQRVAHRTAQLADLTTQLTRSRNLLQTLFDGLADGVLLLDHTGAVRAANQASALLLDRPLEQLLHQTWINVCAALDPPLPADWVLDVLQTGHGEQRRVRYAPVGRRPRVLDIRSLLVPAHDNLPPQLIIHLGDSTERVQLETIASRSERFIASGTLTAMVAHEINTPLQAVQNFLFLVDDATPADRRHFLGLAREELRRVGAIVGQLLDLYRPMTGEPAPVDLNALLERVRQLTRGSCTRQQVTVVTETAPGLPALWGRADQLVQLLLNLVVNALEAMPAGGTLTLTSTLEPVSAGASPAIVLTVSDTGAGVPVTLARDIFEPFVTSKPDGTGLGLAICRTIAVQHGGSVTVRSRAGAGSTFIVRLPVGARAGQAAGDC